MKIQVKWSCVDLDAAYVVGSLRAQYGFRSVMIDNFELDAKRFTFRVGNVERAMVRASQVQNFFVEMEIPCERTILEADESISISFWNDLLRGDDEARFTVLAQRATINTLLAGISKAACDLKNTRSWFGNKEIGSVRKSLDALIQKEHDARPRAM